MNLKLLHFKRLPILEQLYLEEKLIRSSDENFCIINEGTSPAIVLGISGKVDELVDQERAHGLPLIRRFSGGGTVVVDENTLFVSFIFGKESHAFHVTPQALLHWSAEIYRPLFPGMDFQLQENDYALGEKKFGGNAQYLTKDRWLHHSSLLFDYDLTRMHALLLPKRQPAYRKKRSHEEFLMKLKSLFPEREKFIASLLHELQQRYTLQLCEKGQVEKTLGPCRIATELLSASFE